MTKAIRHFCILAALTIMTAALAACGGTKTFGITYADVPLDYGETTLTEIEKPVGLDSRQDLSDFMDWCVFYGEAGDTAYTTVNDAYAQVLRADMFTEYRWAGQYGNLAHNFVTGYDDSRLDENVIGIVGGIKNYAFKSYTLGENNVKVWNLDYYLDVVAAENDRGYALKDFALYKSNNGFVRVTNSEQLFYAAARGYMPVAEEDSAVGEMLSRVLGILNRILNGGMTETQKIRAIYNYLVCENTYDYESFLYKESEHTDYTAYFLEGVFYSKNAVCDGLAKAMTLMCRLEGIEAYHIGAVGSGGGHAYNYIKADGKYYLCCPTQGSSVTAHDGKRFHSHTAAFFLTDYYTSSPSWDFYSGQLPEIGELVKQTEKYDYWSNTVMNIDGTRYDLSPDGVDEAVAVLDFAAETAKRSGYVLQVELLCDYDTPQRAYEIVAEDYNVTKINNGVFGGQRLYAFLFS